MTTHKVIEKINSFVDEDELVKYLVQNDYKGIPCEEQSCPLAIMIYTESKETVDKLQVRTDEVIFEVDDKYYEEALSEIAQNFVEDFDNNQIKELIYEL